MPISSSSRDSLLLLAYCGFLYWLSDQSYLPVPLDFPQQDKLNHTIAYGLMALLAWRCFAHWLPSPLPLALSTSVFCIAYGFSDEWHQSFVPGRSADAWDWLTDSAAAATTAFWLTLKYRARAVQPERL